MAKQAKKASKKAKKAIQTLEAKDTREWNQEEAHAEAQKRWGRRAFAIELPGGELALAFLLGSAGDYVSWKRAYVDAEFAEGFQTYFIPDDAQDAKRSWPLNTDGRSAAAVVTRKAR